jgi:tRNA nucleotidyltransferase/poly(A) polymerase
MLRAHLPRPLYTLLERVGRLADARGVSTYMVGGCVRDLLRSTRNLDVVVLHNGIPVCSYRPLGYRDDNLSRGLVHVLLPYRDKARCLNLWHRRLSQ